MSVQQVKRITANSNVQSIVFDYYSGKYLVKNFSENDLYVSFESPVETDKSIKISSGMGQLCEINERGGECGQEKVNTIYVIGDGEVEVQQLWW